VLAPFADSVSERFNEWLMDKAKAGTVFTPEQLAWLNLIRDHIATSLSIEPDDFDLFGQPPFNPASRKAATRQFRAKQNILEASQASGTSKETELKLTNVARASLEELLEDYRDYLRQNAHPQWDKNSKEALYVRKLGTTSPASYETYREFIETRPAHTVANILICLIHQTNYLLDQQLRRLEQDFLKEGGLRERMTRARLNARAKQQRGGPHAS
jgi:four helix bundle suffix protein